MNRLSSFAMLVLGACAVHFVGVACSGGASTLAAQAGVGGGSGVCECAQPTIVEVACEPRPNIGKDGTWPSAILKISGRDQASFIGTQAIAKNATLFRPSMHDGASTDYVAVVPLYREDTVVVDCNPLGSGVQMYDSVKFIVPPHTSK